jgi:Tol biopolymer transport system component
MIDGVSVPYVMDADGRNKRDVSGGPGGFVYGYSASPNGRRISYHEDYQLYIANVDGTDKRHIETGNPFNFGPQWSPDGRWLLFLSGMRGQSDPWIVRADGSGARKLADCNGYRGWVLFLDVDDYHEGSSDTPTWGLGGECVYFTAAAGAGTIEIVRADMEGQVKALTRSEPGTLNYQPIPSPDGEWICFGSNRSGTRQLYVTDGDGTAVWPITCVPPGWGAMWPYWQCGAK